MSSPTRTATVAQYSWHQIEEARMAALYAELDSNKQLESWMEHNRKQSSLRNTVMKNPMTFIRATQAT